jgi:hypothetical protein
MAPQRAETQPEGILLESAPQRNESQRGNSSRNDSRNPKIIFSTQKNTAIKAVFFMPQTSANIF